MLVPLPRSLKAGDKGQDVLMVKRAISRAGYRKWGFGFTLGYGPILVQNVKKFQADHKLTVDGQYGPLTHAKLAPFFDPYGASVMVKLAHDLSDPIQVAVATNLLAYNHAWLNAYSEGSGRMQIVRDAIRPLATLAAFYAKGKTLVEDCSSFQTGASFIAGLINPNSGNKVYTTEGYTGTMTVHGTRIATPRKGALGFYGPSWPYKHVVRALEDGPRPKVGSHGGPGFNIEYVDYRGDFNHWRYYD